MTPADLSRLLAPVYRRMMLAVGRAVLRAVNDGGGLQLVQVSLLSEETRQDVERMQIYGLTSVPLAGAEAVVVAVGGSRDNPVALAVDDRRFRPTGLTAGEVCIYSRRPGQRITLLADGTVLIQADKLRIEAPLTEIEGDVTVTGDVAAGGVSLREHVHGGVETGSGSTAPPSP